MTPATAHALCDALVAHGFSCQAIHGKDGASTVQVKAPRLVTAELVTLIEVGEQLGCVAHLIEGEGLTYFQGAA
ncbi:MAG TPA: hypothetical protein VFT50_11550 [Baekduia sp.]|nr:hypothetical protein [Baekduia sp.]